MFRVFIGSGGSRVRGSPVEEESDLSEILDASVGHCVVSLKQGHSYLKGEELVFRCRRLRFAGSAGSFASILLKAVFR